MADNHKTQSPPAIDTREVAVKYVKSNFFRVIHADGAYGGVSPYGDVHMAFYNERRALPDASKITVSSEGQFISEKNEADSELVREVECDVVFDLSTAMRIKVWLEGRIKGLQEMVEHAEKEQAEGKAE